MDPRLLNIVVFTFTLWHGKLIGAAADGQVNSEDIYSNGDILRYVSTCCNMNSQSSCVSSAESTSIHSIAKLFGHKLNCNTLDIQAIQVNLTWVHDSTLNFVPAGDEGGLIYLNEVTYTKDSYCLYDKSQIPNHISMLMCSPGCSTTNPCHRKCCGFQQSLSLNKQGNGVDCGYVEVGQSFFIKNWISKSTGISQPPKFINFQLERFSVSCGTAPDRMAYDFKISEDGSVEYQHAHNTFIPLRNYCVDELLDDNGNGTNLVVLMCNSDIINHMWTPTALQFSYSFVSSLFLGISVAVYFLIRKEHSIHGWTQLAFLVAAFLFYVMKSILGSWNLYTLSRDEMTLNEIALVDNFFVFGLLLNLVNMNAHVFWTFLKLMPESKLNKSHDFRGLIISLVVCWTCAAILALIIFITYFTAEKGVQQMELTSKAYIAIVVLLCGVTLSLGMGTFIILCRRFNQRSTISSTRDSNSTQLLGVIVRFFCITGLVWTTQILELLVKKAIFARGWIWDSIQFLIYINGVVLFFVFVCNKKVLRSLTKTFPENYVFCKLQEYFARGATSKKNDVAVSNNVKISSTTRVSAPTPTQ